MLTFVFAFFVLPTGQVMPQRFAASSTRTWAAFDSRAEAASLRTTALSLRSTRVNAVSADIQAGATIVAPASCKNFLRCILSSYVGCWTTSGDEQRSESDASAQSPM